MRCIHFCSLFLGLCIATSSGQKHELLELLLPDKMMEDEEQEVRFAKVTY